MRTFQQSFIAAILLGVACISAEAEMVRFETSLGNFDVELFDQDAPKTVANFMDYVSSDSYDDSIFHRSVPGFVVQGGGFMSDFSSIESKGNVDNEFSKSNLRGTIAMAKLGGDPNSATSQWFFNLADNGGNLDNQNGGFTVFGEVVGDGMTVVDQIAELQIFGFAGAFGSIPLMNYTDADFPNQPTSENLVMINDIRIVPEPSSLVLMVGLGLGLLRLARTR